MNVLAVTRGRAVEAAAPAAPRLSRVTPRRALAPVVAFALLAALLSGCALTPSPIAEPTPDPDPVVAGDCSEVAVVVDFGPLDAPSIGACVAAGPATDVLAAAGVDVEGTVDYGDQVVCRVAGRPGPDETVEVPGAEPFVEACTSMPSADAYWALWVRADAEAAWEYATEGVATLQLAAGESIGLVYTPGTEQTPPLG